MNLHVWGSSEHSLCVSGVGRGLQGCTCSQWRWSWVGLAQLEPRAGKPTEMSVFVQCFPVLLPSLSWTLSAPRPVWCRGGAVFMEESCPVHLAQSPGRFWMPLLGAWALTLPVPVLPPCELAQASMMARELSSFPRNLFDWSIFCIICILLGIMKCVLIVSSLQLYNNEVKFKTNNFVCMNSLTSCHGWGDCSWNKSKHGRVIQTGLYSVA